MLIWLRAKPSGNWDQDMYHFSTATCFISKTRKNTAPHWAWLKQSIVHCRMHLAVLFTFELSSMKFRWKNVIQSWCAVTVCGKAYCKSDPNVKLFNHILVCFHFVWMRFENHDTTTCQQLCGKSVRQLHFCERVSSQVFLVLVSKSFHRLTIVTD